MKLPIYQIDAFTSQVFKGNPAAVIPLTQWLPDDILQNIALENNLSETAFLVHDQDGWHLRWFTPRYEVDLCGHATLATAHYMFTAGGWEDKAIQFRTRSGILKVEKLSQSYTMDFPQDTISPNPEADFTAILPRADILEVWKGKSDYLICVAMESDVLSIKQEFNALADWPVRGFIVTAEGKEYDFISRCFYPGAGIPEDPVTGSAHTSLTPFWQLKKGKSSFKAYQASARGGEIFCQSKNGRIALTGQAVTYLAGEIFI